MKLSLLIAILFLNLSAVAFETAAFEPTVVETNNFKFWADAQNRPQTQQLTTCRFLTRIINQGTAIGMKIGVLDSNMDYFGTDLYIPLEDYPLRENYYREFIDIGTTSLYMKYARGVLEFGWLKRDGLWSVVYPFTLQINPELTQPKLFKGKMRGYDKDIFGQPKTHVSEECSF